MADDSNPFQITQQQIEQESDTSSPLTLPDPYSDSGYESDDADSLSDMNFVTNLFENRLDYVQNDVQFPLFMDMIRSLESGVSGLRVVDIDSESDVEEVDEIDGGVYLSGDRNSIRFDDDIGEDLNEENRWDDVDGDRQGFNSDVRVNSEITWEEDDENDSVDNIDDEDFRDLEWEILLAANNFNGEFELENDDGVFYVTVNDDYIYAQTETALKGSPPAAKSVIENLVSFVMTLDYVKENDVVCAVCKDAIDVEETATRLPCSHHYHGECIVPWLNIRNTCPVCRFELPTDDADYEQRKERRDGLGWVDDLNVRYDL